MVTAAVFGRLLTAMVTPFGSDGALDLAAAHRLAATLTQPGWNDGLVINGTTGESATTTDVEKARLVETARAAVGDDHHVLAGVGSADTTHSVAMARAAADAGADGLLVVTPYYSRPTQAGVLRHFLTIADSTDLPVMLYDIPKRTGTALTVDTLVKAGQHEQIVAVKEAGGDFTDTALAMRETSLEFYSGDDLLNLPYLAMGFAGFVSVVGHVAGPQLRTIIDCATAGDLATATTVHRRLVPLNTGMFRAPAAASVKYALSVLGQPCGAVRPPLVPLTDIEERLLDADLSAQEEIAR
jgi:4-hydroxy-tetrahydrodipicolinate synthase